MGPLYRAGINYKNNGTVTGFQAVKCRYIEGSNNGPVTGPYGPVNFYLCSQGLSRYLETGCPNRGSIDCCVSKVWYKIHTTNKIDPIPLHILLF